MASGVFAPFGALLAGVGAVMTIAAHSMNVNTQTGERSMKLTDEAAINSAVSIGLAALGGAAAASASGATSSAVTFRQAAKEFFKSAVPSLVQSGFKYDEKGRSQGFDLSGKRGDIALGRAVMSGAGSVAGMYMPGNAFGDSALGGGIRLYGPGFAARIGIAGTGS